MTNRANLDIVKTASDVEELVKELESLKETAAFWQKVSRISEDKINDMELRDARFGIALSLHIIMLLLFFHAELRIYFTDLYHELSVIQLTPPK
jgi:hypothetical protein